MSEKRKLFVNSLSMVINKLSQGIVNLVLSAVIARTLGAEALGQYVLGISFFYIFVNLASEGFKTLFTREIARDPDSTPLYLVNGLVLQLSFCIVSYLALLVVIFLLPYSNETTIVCYIIGLTIIPFALSNITESILQAQERMYLIAISTAPIYTLRLVVITFAINLNYGINDVGIMFVVSESMIFIIQWLFVTRDIKPNWKLDHGFIWENINKVRTFIAIEGMGIFAAKIDILLVSLLGNEILIGVYGAMKQLLQPFFIVSSSVSLAGFPKIAKAAMVSKSEQKEVAENIISILLFMGLPFFVSLIFVGQDLLLFVYQDSSFQGVELIFNLLAISVITSSFGRTFHYLLTANGYEKLQLVEVLITTTVSGLVGILLISEYKLMGAAYMSAARTITSFATLYLAVYTRILVINFWKVLKLPLLLTSLIALVFYILENMNANLLVTIIVSSLAYVLFAGSIAVYISGGINNLQQKLKFNQRFKQ